MKLEEKNNEEILTINILYFWFFISYVWNFITFSMKYVKSLKYQMISAKLEFSAKYKGK